MSGNNMLTLSADRKLLPTAEMLVNYVVTVI